jgi:oligopeptide transport system substrate-binding protein
MRPGKALKPGVLSALCCLVAMLLTGCSGGSTIDNGLKQTKAPISQQVYRYGDISTDIATFDPGQATDLPSTEAIDMVFTGLVQMDDNLQVQPQLAQSYDISRDGLIYTFHLRPNLKFSDGSPLTANDVAYSIDRALSPAVSNANGVTLTYLGLIKDAPARVNGKMSTLIGDSIRVLDNNTLQLIVSQQTSYFLEALTYPTSYVVERSVIDKWGSKWTDHLSDNGGQGGDGPFKVQSYNHTTGIVFVPNTNYYGPQPQLQRVEFDFYKTAETAFQAYQAGQVDFVKNLAPDDLSTAQTLPDDQYRQSGQLAIDYIAMNYLYKPFDNVHIRQAFELAINKNVISNAIFQGTRPATCHIIPNGMPGYNPNLKCPYGASLSGDPVKAKALFAQGLKEEGLTLAHFPKVTITYRSNSTAVENEMTTMRQQWQQVLGVTVNAQSVDFNQLLKEAAQTPCTQSDLSRCLNQGLQMWSLGWIADYPDPQDWITLQFGRGAPNNQWNYGENLSSVAAEQQKEQLQMALADQQQNQLVRLSMYDQIEQQLINDVAWMPLDQRSEADVIKPYVVGQLTNAQSLIPPNDWGNIYIAVH